MQREKARARAQARAIARRWGRRPTKAPESRLRSGRVSTRVVSWSFDSDEKRYIFVVICHLNGNGWMKRMLFGATAQNYLMAVLDNTKFKHMIAYVLLLQGVITTPTPRIPVRSMRSPFNLLAVFRY